MPDWPARSPRAIATRTALLIVELRRRRLTHVRIARRAGVSASTVSRVLTRAALAYYARLGVNVKCLLTDNGAAFCSQPFRAACAELGIQQQFTRAYRPQTGGKAERFIQLALREWAYAWVYQNSAQRARALAKWQHHYNYHRPYAGIGGVPPISRLSSSRNNLLTIHR